MGENWNGFNRGDVFATMGLYYYRDITREEAERVFYTVIQRHMTPAHGAEFAKEWMKTHNPKTLVLEWLQTDAVKRMRAFTDDILYRVFTSANRSYYYGISIPEAEKILWRRFKDEMTNARAPEEDYKIFGKRFGASELVGLWFNTDAVIGMKNVEKLLFRAFALLFFVTDDQDELFFSAVKSILWFWYASSIVRFIDTHPSFLKDRFQRLKQHPEAWSSYFPKSTKRVTQERVLPHIKEIMQFCEEHGGPEKDRDSAQSTFISFIIQPEEARQPHVFLPIEEGDAIHIF